jgi:hypothetical protein
MYEIDALNGLKNVRIRRHDALSRVDWRKLEVLLADHYRRQGSNRSTEGTTDVADVFVSYCRREKSRVAPLVAAIEAMGWSECHSGQRTYLFETDMFSDSWERRFAGQSGSCARKRQNPYRPKSGCSDDLQSADQSLVLQCTPSA